MKNFKPYPQSSSVFPHLKHIHIHFLIHNRHPIIQFHMASIQWRIRKSWSIVTVHSHTQNRKAISERPKRQIKIKTMTYFEKGIIRMKMVLSDHMDITLVLPTSSTNFSKCFRINQCVHWELFVNYGTHRMFEFILIWKEDWRKEVKGMSTGSSKSIDWHFIQHKV